MTHRALRAPSTAELRLKKNQRAPIQASGGLLQSGAASWRKQASLHPGSESEMEKKSRAGVGGREAGRQPLQTDLALC